MSFLDELTAVEQRSDLWDKERLEKFTASENHRLVTPGKRKMTPEELAARPKSGEGSRSTTIEDPLILSDGAITYVLEKVAEAITGQAAYHYDTMATTYGVEHEHKAKMFYYRKFGVEIQDCGFFPYHIGKTIVGGASPDGKLEEEVTSGVEIKCPFNSVNHLQHLLIVHDEYFKTNFPAYYWQCQMGMLTTGWPQWKFISYDPRMVGNEMFVYVLKRNDADCKLLETKLKVAHDYKTQLIKALTKQVKAVDTSEVKELV